MTSGSIASATQTLAAEDSAVIGNGDSLARKRLAIFLSQVRAQEDKTKKKRDRAQRGAYWLGIVQVGSLAATPIFIGLSNMGVFSVHNVIALILSAVSLFTGSILAAFTYRERWRGFARIAGRLHALEKEAAYLEVEPPGSLRECAVEDLRLQLRQVLDEGSDAWQATVQEPGRSGSVRQSS